GPRRRARRAPPRVPRAPGAAPRSFRRRVLPRSSGRTRAAAARTYSRSREFVPRDATAVVVPLARIAGARSSGLPRLRRGGVPARIVARAQRAPRPAGLHVWPGTGNRRRRGTATVARSRGPDASPLARPGRGRVLRDVLLRVGDAVLSRPRPVRSRRPNADAARAGALRLLARV